MKAQDLGILAILGIGAYLLFKNKVKESWAGELTGLTRELTAKELHTPLKELSGLPLETFNSGYVYYTRPDGTMYRVNQKTGEIENTWDML